MTQQNTSRNLLIIHK